MKGAAANRGNASARANIRCESALPLVVLALYGLGFGWTALAGGPLAGGDHPGQLYRVAHALTIGLPPWRLNPGWWAGYAELQYYPPGMAYLGAALHAAALGRLGPFATYQVLLWITFLLPGFTMYALMVRVLGSSWLALPPAFLALTLSAGSRSGVEEGVRWGLVAARLGGAVLPLLALSLHRWTERRAVPLEAAVLLAAVGLFHPAHWPAAMAMVMLAAWHGPGRRWARVRDGLVLTAAGGGLAGFWLLPLIAHRFMALPLAWGEHSLSALVRTVSARPLSVVLVAVAGFAWWGARREPPQVRWLCGWPAAIGAIILADSFVGERLGILWLPADRLLDSVFVALIVSSGLALFVLRSRIPELPAVVHATMFIALCLLLSFRDRGEGALSLWPRGGPNEWPKYSALSQRFSLPGLWEALRNAPPGRILFLRSSLPLEDWPSWFRPRTHITALAPLLADREILNGTFTHPSPIAGVVYTGSPADRPITKLVEERDGVTLFGRPLDQLEARTFDELADRFLVSAVVVLAEDESRVAFLESNPRFRAPVRVGMFRIFTTREPRPTPEPVGLQHWRATVPAHPGGWHSLGVAYSPLWRVRVGERVLPARRDELGVLEVDLPAGEATQVDIEHTPGVAEWGGMALSAAAALLLAAAAYRRRRQQ